MLEFVAPFEILIASVLLYQYVSSCSFGLLSFLDIHHRTLITSSSSLSLSRLPLRLPLLLIPFSLLSGVTTNRLLGISAFAGFIVLLLGWPLNSFIARRSIRIQKGVMAARDRRMGVLNELIGAVSDPFLSLCRLCALCFANG